MSMYNAIGVILKWTIVNNFLEIDQKPLDKAFLAILKLNQQMVLMNWIHMFSKDQLHFFFKKQVRH